MAKSDVTPESQQAKYEARGGEVTSIGDEINAAYSDGYAAGRRTPAGPTTTYRPGRAPVTDGETVDSSAGRIRLQAPGTPPSIAAPLLVELVLITVDEIANQHRPPIPSRLLAVLAVFGTLSLARGNAARPAAAFGWALVVSTFYARTVKGRPPAALNALATLGNFMSGKYAVRTPAATTT